MTPRDRRPPARIAAPSAVRFLFVAALVPLIVTALLAWLQTEYLRSERLREQAGRSYDRSIAQLMLLSRLKDAEAGESGYLLAGDPIFLARFRPAVVAVRRQLAADAIARDPDLPRGYLPVVSRLTERKLAEMATAIRLFDSGNPTAAHKIADGTVADGVMEDLRQVVGQMVAREQARTRERSAALSTQRKALRSTVLVVVGTLVILVFLFLAILWRLRQLRHWALVDALEAAERNAAVLESTVDAILILNPSGTIEMVNAAATAMLGYQPAELEGCDVGTVLQLGPEAGSFHERIGLEDGLLRRPFLPDRAARHRTGQHLAVDVAMGVMRLPSGDHLVLSLRDISERKQVEEVKDELISTVSHELRTPLTSIVGSLGLLRAGAAGPVSAKAGRLVEIAESNSRRLIRLINDMLDIDRIESGRLEMARAPLDLCGVLKRACLDNEGLARLHRVTLRCRLPDRAVNVFGDGDRLLQVVTNLLSNAVNVSPAGAAVELDLAAGENRAMIRVEDRGPGIPATFRDRIFGRFEQASPSGDSKGTGLGLAISREIVLRHEGAIWFEDRDGGGASFAVSLPLLQLAGSPDADRPVMPATAQ